jgi:hypothetical protein
MRQRCQGRGTEKLTSAPARSADARAIAKACSVEELALAVPPIPTMNGRAEEERGISVSPGTGAVGDVRRLCPRSNMAVSRVSAGVTAVS